MTKIQQRIEAGALQAQQASLQGSMVQVVTKASRTLVLYLQKADDSYLYGHNMRRKLCRVALADIAELIIDKRQE